jgi:uncharacterized protein YbjT (DUF2867 family)
MSHEKKVIAFSSADSYFGESLTRYTATKHCQEFKTIRGLIRKEGYSDELKKLGVEPHQINYDKPETLEKALQGVHVLIFVIEDDEKRVSEAEQLAEAAHKAKACVLLLSCASTEKAEGKRLCEFQEIEQKVSSKVERTCILRVTWPYQLFFLWTRMIQDEGKLRLAIKKENKFAPIDICDIGKAVCKILTKPREEPDTVHRKWVITGPETVTVEDVVKKLNSSVQADVEFEETTADKIKQYLESLKKGEDHTPEDYAPRHSQLTDLFIEINLEDQEYIKQGKGTQHTDELKKIIGEEGQKLEVFFQSHQKDFKPHK